MRKGQHFARAFKRAVAVEYLQSGEERKVIAMKYGLPNVQTISNWVSLYLTPHEIETKCVNLPRINVNAVEMSKVETPQPQVPLEDQQAVIAQLQKQLQKLEKQLHKPTDNAIAERVNGILKTEVIYRERRFKTYQDALERISGFILFYNDTRPHYSIGMKTPSEVHTQTGPQKVMWKYAERLSGAVCPLPQGTP